ncbi:hypothetical protein BAE44_0016006 [Dichanthelium oligosanthes]|uniref:Protein kinase domain-containing protein n=1 Tax=Dichanthelium oligosanthes TaxID=888268 RepID=A0A1E5VD58_9POAL|nr:hypothetical protein BAE44_0016006 [Dichanthelium oligosanthes]
MHGHGIIHREIKPKNILGSDDDVVKICNYGVAKSMAEKDTPCRFTGTIPYMAPEVLVKDAEHDKLMDAWSLGCVMAELLTSKLLFAGKNESNRLFKIYYVRMALSC